MIAFLLNVYNLLDYSCNNGYVWNISKVQRMIRYGASKGVLCEYMTGYIFDTTHEEWEQYVEDGDTVLIWDFSTMEYLNRDVRIGTYTTLSTPTYYVDSMEEYLRMNPDKYPDVIAVSCWYGELNLETDYGHFYEWIEDRYHADTVIDGAYYRYFIRRR